MEQVFSNYWDESTITEVSFLNDEEKRAIVFFYEDVMNFSWVLQRSGVKLQTLIRVSCLRALMFEVQWFFFLLACSNICLFSASATSPNQLLRDAVYYSSHGNQYHFVFASLKSFPVIYTVSSCLSNQICFNLYVWFMSSFLVLNQIKFSILEIFGTMWIHITFSISFTYLSK